MDWYAKVKEWYCSGAWSKEMVENAVMMNKITGAQRDEILDTAGKDL